MPAQVGVLADNIREAVRDERHIFGAHADQRLRERRIMGWQVVAGLDSARLIRERPGVSQSGRGVRPSLGRRHNSENRLGMDFSRPHG